MSEARYQKAAFACRESDIRSLTSDLYALWLRERASNPRPWGYDGNELPDCSTPRHADFGLRISDCGIETRQPALPTSDSIMEPDQLVRIPQSQIRNSAGGPG